MCDIIIISVCDIHYFDPSALRTATWGLASSPLLLRVLLGTGLALPLVAGCGFLGSGEAAPLSLEVWLCAAVVVCAGCCLAMAFPPPAPPPNGGRTVVVAGGVAASRSLTLVAPDLLSREFCVINLPPDIFRASLSPDRLVSDWGSLRRDCSMDDTYPLGMEGGGGGPSLRREKGDIPRPLSSWA